MLASGFSLQKIRSIILRDNTIILVWGAGTGLLSALAATLPSLKSGNAMPWGSLALLITALVATGVIALFLALSNIKSRSLVTNLRIE